MAHIIRPIGDYNVESDTVANPVGICFFDVYQEKLVELNAIQHPFITVDPLRSTVVKYFLVKQLGSNVPYVTVKAYPEADSDLFGVKVIIGGSEPNMRTFSSLVENNQFSVQLRESDILIPLWVYVESKSPSVKVINLCIDVHY